MPEVSVNRSMTELIRSSMIASRGGDGLIDRLKADPVTEPSRAVRFRELVIEHERALKAGDVVAAAIADDALDQLFDESRAAAKEAATEATPAVDNVAEPAPEPISFDAGVRGRRPVRGRSAAARRRPANLGDVIAVTGWQRSETRRAPCSALPS